MIMKFSINIRDGSMTRHLKNWLKEFKDFSTILIKHKDNPLQSIAIFTGISNSKFENIITLDGDGQMILMIQKKF